jgi:Bacterial Ig domain
MVRLIGILFVLISGGPALAAECAGAGIPVTACDNCTISGSIATRRDTSCVRGLSVNRTNYAVVGFKVSKQASHGRVALSGSNFTYSPNKGFTGTDAFTIEFDLTQGDKKVLPTFVAYSVDITP